MRHIKEFLKAWRRVHNCGCIRKQDKRCFCDCGYHKEVEPILELNDNVATISFKDNCAKVVNNNKSNVYTFSKDIEGEQSFTFEWITPFGVKGKTTVKYTRPEPNIVVVP